MSGFFSLGGDKDQEQDHHHHHNNNSLFLFKNQEIYNKGFELWQQYYQLHQQKQNQDQDLQDHVGFPSKRDVIDGDRESSDSRLRRRGRGGGDEEMNCQDCGNQAKKDCPHSRCRTCCKSRGFQCQTHVKSTWIPAAKRRERQHQLAGDNPKRLRELPSGGRAAVSSGFEVGPSFPPEVNSPAVFRCVKVSAVDDAEEHLAYQTAVNIGGHVFKGILYDQGPENRHPGGAASSSGQQGLDLLNVPTHAAMIDHSVYPAPLTAFMAGTQFFPPPRT